MSSALFKQPYFEAPPEYNHHSLVPESVLAASRSQGISLSQGISKTTQDNFQDQYQKWFDNQTSYQFSGDVYHEQDSVDFLESSISQSSSTLPIGKSTQSHPDQRIRENRFMKVSNEEVYSKEKQKKSEVKEIEDLAMFKKENGPENEKSDKMEEYLEKRRKNNASAKKSRKARRMREIQTQILASYLEDENMKLLTIISALKTENSHLRHLMMY